MYIKVSNQYGGYQTFGEVEQTITTYGSAPKKDLIVLEWFDCTVGELSPHTEKVHIYFYRKGDWYCISMNASTAYICNDNGKTVEQVNGLMKD